MARPELARTCTTHARTGRAHATCIRKGENHFAAKPLSASPSTRSRGLLVDKTLHRFDVVIPPACSVAGALASNRRLFNSPTLRLPKFNVEWWPVGWGDRNLFVSSLAAPPVPRAGRQPWSILTLEGGRRVARRGADRFLCIWAAVGLAVQSFVHQPLRSCRIVVRLGLGSESIALHVQ